MNFLAHFLTSRASDDLMSGSFMGDFVRGSVEKQDERFREGIVLHRKVDAFTDDHPLVKESVARLRKSCGRYAAVALDIIYDHLLASTWKEWSQETFESFVARVYAVLEQDANLYPDVAARVARSMIARNWLGSYQSEDGIRFALSRMSSRLRRPIDLAAGLDVVLANRRFFQGDFDEFFSELLGEVE